MEENNKKVRVPVFVPEFTEEMKNAAVNAFQNEKFVMGESVYKFEEEFAKYTGTKLAVSVNSGNAALHLSLLALGINNKSSVILSYSIYLISPVFFMDEAFNRCPEQNNLPGVQV